MRSKALVAVPLLAGLAVVPSGATAAGSCTAAKNVEAIIDDSISMKYTDEDLLRVRATNLLINTLPGSTIMGAVEFGGALQQGDVSADTVFAPAPLSGNEVADGKALDAKVKADNGVTDYNAAFAQSDKDNPQADARIFLTDGGHDVGEYQNGHLVHPVPTHVISFNIPPTGTDAARLQKIADDTHGTYHSQVTSADVQAVMNTVGAELTCQTPPRTFKDALKQGQSKPHKLAVGAKTRTLRIVLSWPSPLDRFTLVGLKLKRGKKLLATGAKVRKLKVTRKRSDTFLIVNISRLRKGRLLFKVKATKVGSGSARVKLTTQVGRGRRK